MDSWSKKVVAGIAAVGVLASSRVVAHGKWRTRALPARNFGAESIAVLGTAQYDGRPSKNFIARLDHAAKVHEKTGLDVITLGGNLPGDRFTEAHVGAEYLRDRGIPVHDVAHGNNTAESLEALPADRAYILVTEPLHALRTEHLGTSGGRRVFVSATPDSPTQFPGKSWWKLLIHEVGGMVVVDVARVAGWPVARRIEAMLRLVQVACKPSDQQRLETLKES